MIRSFVANIPSSASKRGLASTFQYSTLFNKEQKSCLLLINPKYQKLLKQNATTSSTVKKDEINEEIEKPVSFTKSKAFKTKPTFVNPRADEKKPPLQDLSIFISMASFMIYFFYLREENDVDEMMGVSLYSRIDGLEKANLIASIRYHEREKLDTTALNNRLSEIIAEEEQHKTEYEEKEQELRRLYVKS